MDPYSLFQESPWTNKYLSIFVCMYKNLSIQNYSIFNSIYLGYKVQLNHNYTISFIIDFEAFIEQIILKKWQAVQENYIKTCNIMLSHAEFTNYALQCYVWNVLSVCGTVAENSLLSCRWHFI